MTIIEMGDKYRKFRFNNATELVVMNAVIYRYLRRYYIRKEFLLEIVNQMLHGKHLPCIISKSKIVLDVKRWDRESERPAVYVLAYIKKDFGDE